MHILYFIAFSLKPSKMAALISTLVGIPYWVRRLRRGLSYLPFDGAIMESRM